MGERIRMVAPILRCVIGRRQRPFLLFSLGVLAWMVGLLVQHASVLEVLQENQTAMQPSPSFALHHSLQNKQQLLRDDKDIRKKQNAENSHNTWTTTDATFNGIPLGYRAGPIESTFDCKGVDNQQSTSSDSWMFRSCRFHNLCFDMSTRDYVIFLPQKELAKHHDWNSTHAVALGGINPRWDLRNDSDKGSWKVKWFPRVQSSNSLSSGYYQFPLDHILIPFHSFAAHNVGHLLWDDFYPIFSLVRMFGLLHKSKKLVPIRHVISQALYATCEIRKNKRQQCAANLAKFLPLLGVDPNHFSTSKLFQFNLTDNKKSKSNLVCASTALVGLGMLTDHGFRDHGWNENLTMHGYNIPPHNLGRGPNFASFSNFMVENLLGKQVNPGLLPVPPIQVTFSLLSSRDKDRRLDFSKQLSFLEHGLNSQFFKVEPRTLWEMTMVEQVQLACQSHIFVTACGGGSMTATFLPRGSTLIVYYNPTGGVDFSTLGSLPHQPARLDWDLLNNAGYLRVHWLPISTMNEDKDINLLHQLILHEAQIILDDLKQDT